MAVTAVLAVNVSAHSPVALHPPPLHPAKLLPEAGVAVRVTVLKEAEQVVPQLIPDGLLVTIPLPVPALFTVNVYVLPAACIVKVAVTVVAAFIVMEQMPVPEHPPLHPVKLLPEAGAAVRVIVVPLL